MSNLYYIRVSKEEIINRQKALQIYVESEWELTPYTVSYWYGHLAEELDEYLENPTLDELADVIVFLQALSVVMYGRLTLVLSPVKVNITPFSVRNKLSRLRKHLPRKSWKTTPNMEYVKWVCWCEEFIGMLMATVGNYTPAEVKLAYESKLRWNQYRADWERK